MRTAGPNLKPSDVATMIGSSTASVRGMIRAGDLEAYVLPSGQYRIAPEAVERMLRPASTRAPAGVVLALPVTRGDDYRSRVGAAVPAGARIQARG